MDKRNICGQPLSIVYRVILTLETREHGYLFITSQYYQKIYHYILLPSNLHSAFAVPSLEALVS